MKPYYEESGIVIYHGDCREILPQLPKVDLVLTDPPYGCNKAEWDGSFPLEWYRLALCDMAVIITGSAGLRDSIGLVGDDFVDVIVARNLNGMTRGPIGFGNWLGAVVARGKPRQGPNCFDFTVTGDMPDHPSPKPLSYMLRIVARVSEADNTILDPFMGSGTTLVAAKRLGRKAMGIEIEEKYCEIAARRVQDESLPLLALMDPQQACLDLDESTPHRSDDWLRALSAQDAIKEEVLSSLADLKPL